MSPALRISVIVIAAVEAAAIGLFALGAQTSDPLGRSIAMGVALLLAAPFAALTVPALIMAMMGRWLWAALALALSSLLAMAVLWSLA